VVGLKVGNGDGSGEGGRVGTADGVLSVLVGRLDGEGTGAAEGTADGKLDESFKTTKSKQKSQATGHASRIVLPP